MKSRKIGTVPATQLNKTLESKWGKTLISAGFTAMPNVIFQNQKKLNLKPLDILILLHLASYWWNAAEHPRPAKGTLAAAIDVDPRTVQRSIKKMEDLGYVQRIVRKAEGKNNLPNEYDLGGLVAATLELADEANVLKAKRISENAKRVAEDKARRETPKAFSLERRRLLDQ